MEEFKREAIIAQAVALVADHFEFLNAGNGEAVRRQLFAPPGIADDALDVYVKTMIQLTPFRLLSISVRRFEDVRRKRHGDIATIWLDIKVLCSLGERSTEITVWWFSASDECQISARPSHWVLEKLRGPGQPT